MEKCIYSIDSKSLTVNLGSGKCLDHVTNHAFSKLSNKEGWCTFLFTSTIYWSHHNAALTCLTTLNPHVDYSLNAKRELPERFHWLRCREESDPLSLFLDNQKHFLYVNQSVFSFIYSIKIISKSINIHYQAKVWTQLATIFFYYTYLLIYDHDTLPC